MGYWFIFALFGPPLGYLVFVIGGAILSRGMSLEMWPATFIIGLLLSYVAGLVPALIAASIIRLGRWGSFKAQLVWVSCAGLAVGILFAAFIGAALVESGSEIDLPSMINRGSVMYVLVCLIPTLACWHLSRRLAQPAA